MSEAKAFTAEELAQLALPPSGNWACSCGWHCLPGDEVCPEGHRRPAKLSWVESRWLATVRNLERELAEAKEALSDAGKLARDLVQKDHNLAQAAAALEAAGKALTRSEERCKRARDLLRGITVLAKEGSGLHAMVLELRAALATDGDSEERGHVEQRCATCGWLCGGSSINKSAAEAYEHDLKCPRGHGSLVRRWVPLVALATDGDDHG